MILLILLALAPACQGMYTCRNSSLPWGLGSLWSVPATGICNRYSSYLIKEVACTEYYSLGFSSGYVHKRKNSRCFGTNSEEQVSYVTYFITGVGTRRG